MTRLRSFAIVIFLAASLATIGVHPAPGPPREIKGADGAPMVLVPKGEFVMGSEPGAFIFGDNETPQRRVYLDAFYIDKFEVTNALFNERFASKSGYRGNLSGDRQPVVGVSWFQAKSYCASAQKRLPTEAEWEKAARGTDGRVYPWGGRPADCALAVMGGCSLMQSGLRHLGGG